MRAPRHRALRVAPGGTGKAQPMAALTSEYRFITGSPDDALAEQLTKLDADGWIVSSMAGDARTVVLLLHRTRAGDEPRALLAAIEELPEADASDPHIPAEERL